MHVEDFDMPVSVIDPILNRVRAADVNLHPPPVEIGFGASE
jgi:hypothetical protein